MQKNRIRKRLNFLENERDVLLKNIEEFKKLMKKK
jgi:hypothetical protein